MPKTTPRKIPFIVTINRSTWYLFNINQIDPFEGYFSINLKDNDGRSIYDASFTFLKPNKLLIASIQGPSYEEAQEAVKQATKEITRCSPDVYVDELFSAC